MEVDRWRSTLCLISGSCALAFNLLLAYFILTVRCSYIGKYKWLLFLYTLSAMVNATAQILTLGVDFLITRQSPFPAPVHVFHRLYLLRFVASPSNLPGGWGSHHLHVLFCSESGHPDNLFHLSILRRLRVSSPLNRDNLI